MVWKKKQQRVKQKIDELGHKKKLNGLHKVKINTF